MAPGLVKSAAAYKAPGLDVKSRRKEIGGSRKEVMVTKRKKEVMVA